MLRVHQLPNIIALIILILVVSSTLSQQRFPLGPIGTAIKDGVKKTANIINYFNENLGQDGYRFKYETDDNTLREEQGEFVNGIWTVTGLVKWLSPDQKTEHMVKYKADDKGYQAQQETRSLSPGVIASLGG